MAKAKEIFIPGTNMTFKSVSAAAKALGVNAGNISSVLSGRRKTAGGYSFGYASNRVVYVPEKNATYASVKEAAKATKVSTSKADHIASSGLNKTVKGYHFTYADATKITNTIGTAAETTTTNKPKNKKSRAKNKREKIQQHKEKKAEVEARRQQKEEARKKEKEESAKKHTREEQLKSYGEAYFRYKNARSDLESYVKKVNEQLDKYVGENPALLYYHQAAPSVLGLQVYTGWDYGPYDIPYFDESLKKFDLPENLDELSADDLSKMAKIMETINERFPYEAERKDANFFNMDEANKNRTNFALEFYKNTGHEDDLDQYAYMIWDILDVIERSNQYPELGSELIFRMVSDAMQGNVDATTLENFINDLDDWMNRYGSQEELDDILAELDDTYEKPDGYSVFDDDEGWTT